MLAVLLFEDDVDPSLSASAHDVASLRATNNETRHMPDHVGTTPSTMILRGPPGGMPQTPAPGQESVWAFPRPAIAEPSSRHIRIVHWGATLADTRCSVRTLETSHPPSYYVPPADVLMSALQRSDRRSVCEWKGEAIYYDLVLGGKRVRDIAWSYPAPTPPFSALRDHLAFYAAPFDACSVDGERVIPQPGGFYGGWITADLAGPFKGVPGSRFW